MKTTARPSCFRKTAPIRHAPVFSRTAIARGATPGFATGAILEQLEDRTLQSSVWLAEGVLNIQGGTDPRLDVNLGYNARHGELKVHVKGQRTQEFLRSAVNQIKIVGTNGSDHIILSRNEPVAADIHGLDGNDVIVGGAGSDTIICGAGRDRVWGQRGNDVIFGGAGSDSLYGGRGNDQLHAGTGNDLLDGGPGQNRLFGGVGRDVVRNGIGDFGRIGHKGVVESGRHQPILTSGNQSSPPAGRSTSSGGNTGSQSGSNPGAGATTGGTGTGGSKTSGSGSGAANSGSGRNGSGSVGSPNLGSTGPGAKNSGSAGSGATGSGATGSGATGSGATGSGATGPGATGPGATGSTGSGYTGSGSTAETKAAPTAVIQFIDQVGMAGHTVHVDGLNSAIHNGAATDATFKWDFGDPGSAYNTLTGFNAAHRYTQPGKYTVSLTITDSAGKTSTTTGAVSIGSDARRLIYVNSQTGNDSNSGTSPDYPIQTLAQAAKFISHNTEILLCRGQTYALGDTFSINSQNVLISAYGQGANPTIMKGPGNGNFCFYTAPTCKDITFQDLNLDSIWGLNSVYGAMKVPAGGFSLGGRNISVIGCQFHNVTDAVNTQAQPTGVLIQDNYMGPELRGYGIWGEGMDHVYVGNTMTNSTQEHLIRADDGAGGIALSHVLIAYNNLSRHTNSKGSIELRTCTWFYVAHNRITGGTLRVGLQEQDKAMVPNWAALKTGDGVIENNTTHGIFWNFRPGVFDVAVRNNVIQMDNLPAIEIECIKSGYDQVRKTSDVRIYNNTAIDNGTTGAFLTVDGQATGLVVANNVLVAPNLKLDAIGESGAICVINGDLSSFKEIKNNVWPARLSGAKQAGLNYVGPSAINASNYVTNETWNSLPQVSNDTFRAVTLGSDGFSVRINQAIVGAQVKAA